MRIYFILFLFFISNSSLSQWKQYGQSLLGEAEGDESGRSVAINASGRIVAIGSHKNDGGGNLSGSVRVYQNTSFLNTSLWYQIGSDIDGGLNTDQSGYTVSMSGDGYTIAVTHINLTPAIVKVYRYRDNEWVQIGENITGLEDNSEFFGVSTSLSFDGNIIAIGDSKGFNSKGYVQIFNYSNSKWDQIGETIQGESAADESGFSVSISDNGKIIAIGAPQNDANGDKSGHVRVYENIGDEWNQIGSDIDGSSSKDYAGYSVSLNNDGTILAVGMPYNDGGEQSWCDPCTDAGKVRVYENKSGYWTQIGSDLKGKGENERFGWSLSLNGSGKILTVGAPGYSSDRGQVRVFKYSSGSWSQENSDINATENNAEAGLFGYSVSSNDEGNIFISGAIKDKQGGTNAGISKVYTNSQISSSVSGNIWTLDQTLDATYDNSTATFDRIGVVMEISGDGKTFVTNHNTNNSFRVYKKLDNVWALDTVISPTTSSNGQSMNYGFNPSFSLSHDGNTIAFGVPRLSYYSESGYINIYTYDGSSWSQKGETIIGTENKMNLGWNMSLSRDGTKIAAGGPFHNNNNYKGKVLTYEYSTQENKWVQFGDDITSKYYDSNGNKFGIEVDFNDEADVIAVGSLSKTEIFRLEDNTWKHFGSLGDSYNQSVLNNIALSSDGNTILLGYPLYECNTSTSYRCEGKAQVFRYSDNSWKQIGSDISPEIEDNLFGNSVAISGSGSRIVISAAENNYTSPYNTGVVHTYELNTSSEWVEITQNIEGVHTDNNNNDRTYFTGFWNGGFNYLNPVSLSDDGSTMIVGYPSGKKEGKESSRIKSYTFSQSSTDNVTSDLVANEDSYHFYNGSTLDITLANGVSSNDYSFSGVNFTVQLIEDVDYGNLKLNSDGSFTYVHDGSLHDDYFTYRIVDDNGKISSSQYVFLSYSCGNEPSSDDRVWSQVGTNILPDSIFTLFGTDVAMSDDGNVIAVSTKEDLGYYGGYYNNYNSGYVKVYQNILGRWVQMGERIMGEAENDKSGTSISLSSDGKIIAIGAPENDSFNGTNSGHVRVYKFTSGQWEQIGEDINGPSDNDGFGYSLDISADGKVIVIGAPLAAYRNRGMVRVYELNESEEWERISELYCGNSQGSGGCTLDYFRFGYDVSISDDGNIIAVGNNHYETYAEQFETYPYVNIYKRDESSENCDPNCYTKWGESISGKYYDGYFGSALDLSGDGDRILIGASEYPGNSTDTDLYRGSAFVYENINGSWIKIGKDLHGENKWDYFGKKLSLSGNGKTIAIGADGYDSNLVQNIGRVYLYKYEGCDWRETATVDGEFGSEGMGNIEINNDGSRFIRGSREVNAITNLKLSKDNYNSSTKGIARVYRLNENLPELSLSFSKDTISESFEKSIGTVSINKSSDYDIYAILKYSGTAQNDRGDIDYKYSKDTVIISAGSTTKTFYIESITDPIKDDNEIVTVDISSAINSIINSSSSSKSVVIKDVDNSTAYCDNFDYNLSVLDYGTAGYSENTITSDSYSNYSGPDTSYQNIDLFRIPNYSWVSNYKPDENNGGGYNGNIYNWHNQIGCLMNSSWNNTSCISLNENFDNNYIVIRKYNNTSSLYQYLSKDFDDVGKNDFIEFDYYANVSEKYLQIKNQSSNPDIESNWTSINFTSGTACNNNNCKLKLKDFLDDFQGGDITVRFKIKLSTSYNYYTTFAFDNFCIKTPEAYYKNVRLNIDKKEISEDGKQSSINLTIDESNSEDITIKLKYSGSASGNDYKFIGADSAIISTGNTSASVTLESVDDNLIEGDELIIVSIDDVTNAVEAGVQEDTITILDNDTLLTIISKVDQILCYGEDNGKISLSVDQGKAPYSFLWTKDDESLSLDNDTIDKLAPGSYRVEVRDADGKYPTSETFVITQPDSLVVEILSSVNASCDGDNDGQININVTGGSSPYTFVWTTTDGLGLNSSSEDQSGLSAGSYMLKVTDVNGCEATISKTLDDSGRKNINSSWFKKDELFNLSLGGLSKDQDANDIYSISMLNDNDGVIVGEYGDLTNTFTSDELNTSDSWENHFYHLYEISDGKSPYNGSKTVDITYLENEKENLNKNITESFYFDDYKVLTLAEDYILRKSSDKKDGDGQWESNFVDGTITSSHFTSSSLGWVSGRYNDNGFFFDEIRSLSINSENSLVVEEKYGINKKVNSIYSVKSEADDSHSVWAVGESGYIIYSDDSGKNWTEINSQTSSSLNSVFVIKDGESPQVYRIIIVGDNGLIKYSTIDLNLDITNPSWNSVSSVTSNNLNEVKFISNGYGLIVGDGGVILSSQDFGNSWSAMSSGTQENLNDLDFGECSNVYVVGDNGTLLKSSNFTITDISVDNLEFDENMPAGSFIGLISSSDDDQYADHTYTFGAGSGSQLFEIRGDSLFSNVIFNFEGNSFQSLTIKSSNSNGKIYSKSFVVIINNKDEIFDISLSTNQLQENRSVGTIIGELSVIDENSSAGVIFELVDSLDSEKFTLNGTSLLSNIMFDYENKDEHKVVVKAISSGGYSYIKTFNIVITDAEDVNSISLSNNTIDENSNIESVVGSLLTDNANANIFANFSLTESTQFDNDKFKIEDNKLLSLEVFDYESDIKSYTVEVSVASSGFNNLTDTVNVFVNNLPDAIDDVYLTNSSINENLLPGGTVGELRADDQYDALQNPTDLIITGIFETKGSGYQGIELYAVKDIDDLSKYGISVSSGTTPTNPNEILNDLNYVIDAGDYIMIYYNLGWQDFFSNEASSSFHYDRSDELFNMSEYNRFNVALYENTNDNWRKIDVVGDHSQSASGSNWDVSEGWLYRKSGRGATVIYNEDDWNINKNEFSLIGGNSVNGNDLASNPYPLFSYILSETSQTFELVFGEGDDHNSLFEIVGDKLIANETFDYETKDTYSVRVKATSSRGYSLEKILTISVNDLPDQIEDITISNNKINENEDEGSFVGYLLAQDQYELATHNFELVDGIGADDNQYFDVNVDQSGNSILVSNVIFDYEDKSVYSIRVKAISSNGGYTFEKVLSISINDLPDQILDISLSPNEIYENQPVNTLIGQLSADDQFTSASHTFEFVSGAGDVDNNLFIIVEGTNLKSLNIFDYEMKSSYSIRVEATSSNGGYTFEKVITINIKDLPDAINDISLSNSSVDENLEAGSLIGNLITDDQFLGATHSYIIVDGALNFNIVNSNQLVTKSTFDYEFKDTYSVRVRSTSSNGYFFDKTFEITINDVPDQILDVQLSNNTIAENKSIGTIIGTLEVDDELETATHQFDIISGEGDWQSFSIDGYTVKSNTIFDYETKSTYSFTVRALNSVGSVLDKSLTVFIADDISDNCDPNLSYSGDINSFGSLRVNQTDSLNPSETDYKIIALPFEGYSLSNLTSNMRTDQYMLKQWNGTAYSSAAGSSSIGKGYMFLSTLRPSQIEGIYNECRPSVSVSISGTWAMMGNPYLENIEWSKIESDNGVSGAGFMVYNNGYSFQQTLSPLRGAFISSEELQTSSIQINNPKLNTIEKEYNGKRYNQITGEEWLLDLELKGGNLHHKISQVGERDDASDQRDRYDLALPPSLGYDYGIRFSNDGSRDIRETGSANTIWDFTVDNNYTSKSTIYWTLQSSHNSNLYLLDTESGDIVNMSSESSYSYTGLSSRSFKIIKGDLAFISEETGRVVGGFRLYPNPTSQYLYVESYAKVSTDQIKVYTVDGKEVIPSSKDIVKEDALSQITRLGVRRLKRGTYVVVMSGNSKIFIKN